MLNQYLAMGNTQPGGFYEGGSTMRGGFAAPPTPQKPTHGASAQMYAAPALYAGTGQPAPFMGEATTKMYLNLVNDLVEQRHASFSSPQPTGPQPPHTGPQPHAGPQPPPKWEIDADMMHQKWGSVLRTLQPTAANAQTAPPTAATPRPKQAPAFLTGRSYKHSTNVLPPPGSAMSPPSASGNYSPRYSVRPALA